MSRIEYGNAFERGYSRTLAALRRRGIDSALAEEIGQAAWAHGWLKIHQLRHPRRIASWVNSIALNLLRDAAVNRARLLPFGLEHDRPVLIEADMAAVDLDRTLRKYPRQGEILRRVYLREESPAAVARALHISLDALHARVSRAIRVIRKNAA